jgi:hypothetical protein
MSVCVNGPSHILGTKASTWHQVEMCSCQQQQNTKKTYIQPLP